MIDTASKVHENRVRRAAERQNLRLIKISRRDTRAHDFGLWLLVTRMGKRQLTPTTVRARRGSLNEKFEINVMPEPRTLEAVELWLATEPATR